ncbi:hypothetical protein KCP71_16020 [Salmonella enterica subsp. enterica]|nr:hypothetical protein KCP71_16020 [Salmonella enterica subsp. enterica]
MASTYGVLAWFHGYAHRIPFLVKSESQRNIELSGQSTIRLLYASVEQAFIMGAGGRRDDSFPGSEQSRRQIEETAAAERAYELGMVTALWAYLRIFLKRRR